MTVNLKASRISSSVLALVVALTGCADDPTILQAIDGAIRADCTQYHRCRDMYPNPAPRPFEGDFGADVEACVAASGNDMVFPYFPNSQFYPGLSPHLFPRFSRPTDGYKTALGESVAAGRIAFDIGSYDACNGAIAAMTCAQLWQQKFGPATGDDVFEKPAACQSIVVPQVPLGGECTLSVEPDPGDNQNVGDCADPTNSCTAAHLCVAN